MMSSLIWGMKRLLIILLLATLLVLTACGSKLPTPDDPASQNCLNLGGEIEYVVAADTDTKDREDGGYIGVCHLPGDIDCELWNLFIGECAEVNDRYYCTPDDREYDACIQEYLPVCGFKFNGEQLQTYSNMCEACIADEVSYVTNGEC